MKRKIVFFITKSNWGGAAKNLYDIVAHLDQKKYDILVIFGGHGVLKTKIQELGVRTISIENLQRDMSIMKELKSFLEIFKILRVEKPDIIHLHSPKAAGIGALASRLLKIPKIIHTVHGWTFNEDRSFYQKALIFIFSYITTLLATDIINISVKEANQTKEFPGIKNKVHYIPNGIREPSVLRANQARSFIEQKTGSLHGKKVVGMINELHKNKGLFYTLNAFRNILKKRSDIALVIIGDGEEIKNLEKYIKENDMVDSVFLLGFIENASQYIKAFDIFLMSSIKEGLPYNLLEAAYVGIPTIATTVGGIPEIIDDMKTGILIQPKKSNEIEYAIEFILNHPDMADEFKKASVKKAKQNFSIQKMITSITKLYETTSVR